VNTVSDKVVYPCKNGLRGTSPTTWKFGWNWPTLFKNDNFQSIFAHSASVTTPSENSSIDTNKMGSPLLFQWA